MESMGRLSVIATPIGNLEDITLRALRVFKEVDYVLCEDTRVTGKLLSHYEIKVKLKRYDAHASEKVHADILDDLKEGKHIALVSDAGTPGVSDPGVFLVARVRKENPDVRIDAIPGASALTAAFSIAGIMGNSFIFLGFVPQKKGRETFFKSLSSYDVPVIFYESPHRIMKTLESLKEHLGANSATSPRPGLGEVAEYRITIARELTKMHEEVVQGSSEEVLSYFTENSDHIRGEFVVLVSKVV
jgi:16S rRNA (cytidine1402-2'-O)-methyltransferase